MQNRDNKPPRKVDAREPLEKLSLLNMKKSERTEGRSVKTGTDFKSARRARWM
jgi:hypothetical protein